MGCAVGPGYAPFGVAATGPTDVIVGESDRTRDPDLVADLLESEESIRLQVRLVHDGADGKRQ